MEQETGRKASAGRFDGRKKGSGMDRTEHYDSYVSILREELRPAMGCTEPIAVALAAAKAREALGTVPESCCLEVSGNIVKNVKSVIVPNTGGRKGLEAAAAAGIAVGDPSLELEVLSRIAPEQKEEIADTMASTEISVRLSDNGRIFYIKATLTGGGHTAVCEIADFHTNVTLLQRDGEVLAAAAPAAAGSAEEGTDRACLCVEEIIRFAETVELEDVGEVLERQINYNSAIAEEGLSGRWGANVGKLLLRRDSQIDVKAAATAAAGSDARMSGCELPVVIVSGSGNQGMTASLPVIVYAKEMGASHEALLRALVVSNLITIHQKTSIGRLSAFCGAISAGCGAACGVAYLRGGRYAAISETIRNALATCSGTICDGAKPACASKIAAAVLAGLWGYHMVEDGAGFHGGDGILKDDVEETIASVGRLASRGMAQTDREILSIMIDE